MQIFNRALHSELEAGDKSATAEAVETILGFVRGDISWETLARVGIDVASKAEGFEIDNPGNLAVMPCLRDLAQGLLVHQPMPDQLQMWAGIILAGSSFLDLREAFEVVQKEIFCSMLFGMQLSSRRLARKL